MTELGLGTVQLGLPYGNRSEGNLMPEEEAHAILQTALTANIGFWDTASGYGKSEERIGRFLGGNAPQVSLCTKVPRCGADVFSDFARCRDFFRDHLTASLEKLQQSQIDSCLFHQCDDDFLRSPAVSKAAAWLVESGLCRRVGVSVYTVEQAQRALEIESVRMLQVPVNLIDHRFVSGPLVGAYSDRGITVVARSLFLQGVLHPNADLPHVPCREGLAHIRTALCDAVSAEGGRIDRWIARFIFGNCSSAIDIALVGVQSAPELAETRELMTASQTPLSARELSILGQVIESTGAEALRDPSAWA